LREKHKNLAICQKFKALNMSIRKMIACERWTLIFYFCFFWTKSKRLGVLFVSATLLIRVGAFEKVTEWDDTASENFIKGDDKQDSFEV
jgi:hypothetical protein